MDSLTKKEIEDECKRQDNINDSDVEIALVEKMIADSHEDIKKLERQQFIEYDELCDTQQKQLDELCDTQQKQLDELRDTQHKEMHDLLQEHDRIKDVLKDEHLRQMENSKELLTDHEEHLTIVEDEKKALMLDPLIVPEDFDLYNN